MEQENTNKYPKTFKELFEGTGIEPKVDNDGNTTYAFKDKKIPTLEERIALAQKAVEEMDKRDKNGLSFVDIMKPTQWLNNLLMWKNQNENGR